KYLPNVLSNLTPIIYYLAIDRIFDRSGRLTNASSDVEERSFPIFRFPAPRKGLKISLGFGPVVPIHPRCDFFPPCPPEECPPEECPPEECPPPFDFA